MFKCASHPLFYTLLIFQQHYLYYQIGKTSFTRSISQIADLYRENEFLLYVMISGSVNKIISEEMSDTKMRMASLMHENQQLREEFQQWKESISLELIKKFQVVDRVDKIEYKKPIVSEEQLKNITVM
jgi:regulator of replication initiation timing